MTREQLYERIDTRTEKGKTPDDCWIWTRGLNRGYAQIQTGTNKNRLTKRVATINYERFKGIIPEGIGMMIRHSCDNPRCVNPRHLLIGTQTDNMRDMKERNRRIIKPLQMPFGEKHPMAKLTEEKVREMRKMKSAGIIVREISEKFGVHERTVRRICNVKDRTRGTWKFVSE